jgi:hypothetical protein
MDTSVRLARTITLLAVGCGISTASHAYSKEEDAAAQDREVQAAYDRGYKAAREEMAAKATASAGSPAQSAASGAAEPSGKPSSAPAKRVAGSAAKKPILDQKFTYSDAGEVTTVKSVPVVVKPLAAGNDEQAATAPTDVEAATPAHGQAREYDSTAATPAQSWSQRPATRTYAQAPADRPVEAAPVVQEEAAPPESLADDDTVDEEEAPRQDPVLSTTQSLDPSQPQARYAPPQPYGYAQQPAYAQEQPAYTQRPYPQQYPQQPQYSQQPVYTQPLPTYYAPPAPPAPWGAQYQAQQPPRGVYWSSQYGRWMYY